MKPAREGSVGVSKESGAGEIRRSNLSPHARASKSDSHVSRGSTGVPRRRTTEGRSVPGARAHKASPKAPLDHRLPVFGFWADLRAPFDRWFASLPLPHVKPDVVSGMSLLLAFLFVAAVYQGMPGVAWVFLAVHLFLDGAGGTIAKAWRKDHDQDDLLHGQRLDLFVDRAGELLLFSAPVFVWPWLFLTVVNAFLTLLSIMKHRSYILPLRQAFFVYFTLTLLF